MAWKRAPSPARQGQPRRDRRARVAVGGDGLQLALREAAHLRAQRFVFFLEVGRGECVRHQAYFCRARAAPLPSAFNFAAATSRRIGAMPQLVDATMRSFGTCLSTFSMVAATSSGVSMSSVATSITPIATFALNRQWVFG